MKGFREVGASGQKVECELLTWMEGYNRVHLHGEEAQIFEANYAEAQRILGHPAAPAPETPSVDDLLLQEIFSLREKLKIAVAAIKADNPDFDEVEFLHQCNSVDYDQLMEELNESEPEVSEETEPPEELHPDTMNSLRIRKTEESITRVLGSLEPESAQPTPSEGAFSVALSILSLDGRWKGKTRASAAARIIEKHDAALRAQLSERTEESEDGDGTEIPPLRKQYVRASRFFVQVLDAMKSPDKAESASAGTCYKDAVAMIRDLVDREHRAALAKESR